MRKEGIYTLFETLSLKVVLDDLYKPSFNESKNDSVKWLSDP